MEGEKKAAAMPEEVVEQKAKEAAAGDVSLKDLSKKLSDFAKERNWEQYHSPRNLLLAMVCIFFFFFSPLSIISLLLVSKSLQSCVVLRLLCVSPTCICSIGTDEVFRVFYVFVTRLFFHLSGDDFVFLR